MFDRKEAKKRAKKTLKAHYLLLVFVFLLSAMLGTAHTYSLSSVSLITGTDNISEITDNLTQNGSLSTGTHIESMLYIIAAGDIKEAGEQADQYKENEEGKNIGALELGRKQGVFAELVNNVTSGAVFVTIISAIRNMIGSESAAIFIFIAGMLVVLLGFWYGVSNLFRAISARILLECRIYKYIPTGRFLFLYHMHKWRKSAAAMGLEYVLRTLWGLTIIGYPIKCMAYSQVAYIIAENPNMGAREAITLSRRMMDGHKMELFKVHLSLMGWYLLSVVTLGLCEIFFTAPYQEAVLAEYYVYIREEAKKKGLPGAEKLNDRWLFEIAPEGLLAVTYADIEDLMEEDETAFQPVYSGFIGFMAKHFGVCPCYGNQEEEFHKARLRKHRIDVYDEAVRGEVYPMRLCPIPEKDRRILEESSDYLRVYSLASLVFMFFAFSLVGWLWEVGLHLVEDGTFVNRGMMHGPWLPIYGCGGLLILLFLFRFRKNALTEFLAAVSLCGFVEYMTSYITEIIYKGTKWWDYSGYFININGRICAEGLLVFGLGGIAIVYFLAPHLDDLVRKMKMKFLLPVLAALCLIFVGDMIYSGAHPNTGAGITDYNTEESAGNTAD